MSSSLKCPIEILERVVDLIWEDPDELDFWSNYGDEYRTLCALALSCQHLLPRSRFNLLRRVSLLKMSHLRSFAKTIAHHPHYGDIVRELVILSTGISEDKDPKEPAELSPAESFAVLLANRLPKLRTLRIRTEVDPDMSLNSRPSLYFHPAALASLRSFSSVSHLQLFGLRFREFSDFLHIIQALHGLVVLQCMQIWFRKSLKKDPPPRVSLKPVPKLQTIDLAFIPRSGMKRLLEGLHPGSLRELIITPNTVSSADEAKNTFGSLSQFVHLETFSFFVAVTAKGAEYTDVVALLELVKPHRSLRTVTISHYLHGPDRRHVVPKQTLIDALRRNADMLQAALVPRTFSEDTQIVFQFQGLHGSEGWWEDQLELILPNIFAPTNSPGRRFFRVANVTYSDWSPWADDKDLSAPT
ncbi:hypothetical protein C8Q80DRAFT_1122844 [Daedaleopsis nitida]|nr:hypothetical protein C8Q80DRAFT_1122844 [Daedaleopsis nitida]